MSGAECTHAGSGRQTPAGCGVYTRRRLCNRVGTLVLGADRWAREEDLVIVGVNHRLNVFGYLYLGAFDESYAQSGMAGMLDLVLALEWGAR